MLTGSECVRLLSADDGKRGLALTDAALLIDGLQVIEVMTFAASLLSCPADRK